MSEPGPLNPSEQQQLIQQIGRVIMRALPPGWQEANLEYRAVGAHTEMAAQVIAPNGTVIPLSPPAEAEQLFARLRTGMQQADRGTWISALYRLQRPSTYSVDFNSDYEPAWRTAPPATAFAEELRRYPRAVDRVPGWLAERAGPPTPDAAQQTPRAPALRSAEVFDASDDEGRPVANRPAVSDEERDHVVEYLERAPIVLAARSYDTDQLDPERTPSVPLTFHTDGSWVWPGAVGYYLRQHNVPPESELVAHIRNRGFRLPEVDERARELAVSLITGERSR